MPTPKVAWTVKEFSAATSICESLVWRLIRENRIISIKFGARRLIRTPPEAFLASLAA